MVTTLDFAAILFLTWVSRQAITNVVKCRTLNLEGELSVTACQDVNKHIDRENHMDLRQRNPKAEQNPSFELCIRQIGAVKRIDGPRAGVAMAWAAEYVLKIRIESNHRKQSDGGGKSQPQQQVYGHICAGMDAPMSASSQNADRFRQLPNESRAGLFEERRCQPRIVYLIETLNNATHRWNHNSEAGRAWMPIRRGHD